MSAILAQGSRQRYPPDATHPTVAVVVREHGAEIIPPFNRLQGSPRNARKIPHGAGTRNAFAASIKVKAVFQPPVIDVERNTDGAPNADYFTTMDDGPPTGLRRLAKRKPSSGAIRSRLIADAESDAHEISLGENVTLEIMHLADQFEAFKRLSVEEVYGPTSASAPAFERRGVAQSPGRTAA